jgi:phage recombination protein Bet
MTATAAVKPGSPAAPKTTSPLHDVVEATYERNALNEMANTYGMKPNILLDTLKNTVMPSNASTDDLRAFIVVAHEYGLNPFCKEIYAFPKKGGGIQPIVGIDGWCKIINRHEQFDGTESEPVYDDDGNLYAYSCKIYRKDRSKPTEIIELLEENKRNTEPWKMPNRMLRHRALVQCARIAFGISGVMEEDEARRAGWVPESAEAAVGSAMSKAQADLVGELDKKATKKTRRKKKAEAEPAVAEAEEDKSADIEEMNAKLEEKREQAKEEEAKEKEKPEAYSRLCQQYDHHADLVDETLESLGLTILPNLDWKTLAPEQEEALKRAAAKVAKAISA